MPIQIEDEFSHIPNKKMRMYFRRKRDGLCPSCGGKPAEGHVFCEVHRAMKKAHYLRTRKKKKPSERKYTARPSKYLNPTI